MIQCYVADGPLEGKTVSTDDARSFCVVPPRDQSPLTDWFAPEYTPRASAVVEYVEYHVHWCLRQWFDGAYWVGETVCHVASIHSDPRKVSPLVAALVSEPSIAYVRIHTCPDFLTDFGAWWRWQCIDKGVTQDVMARAEIEAFERARDEEVDLCVTFTAV